MEVRRFITLRLDSDRLDSRWPEVLFLNPGSQEDLRTMLVRRKMHKDLVTVTKDERMTVAKKIMKEKNIRHLPVVDGKKLVRTGHQYGYPESRGLAGDFPGNPGAPLPSR